MLLVLVIERVLVVLVMLVLVAEGMLVSPVPLRGEGVGLQVLPV